MKSTNIKQQIMQLDITTVNLRQELLSISTYPFEKRSLEGKKWLRNSLGILQGTQSEFQSLAMPFELEE